MKERITYIHNGEDEFDPSQLELTSNSLRVKDLKAAREGRLTFNHDELPADIQTLLSQLNGLHVRWAKDKVHIPTGLFNARISSGLHIFVDSVDKQVDHILCPWIKLAFGEQMKCDSSKGSFTTQDSKHKPTRLAYHQNLRSLSRFSDYVESKFCASKDNSCLDRFARIRDADSFDLDYDNQTQSLVIKLLRAQRSFKQGLNIKDTLLGSSKTEIGVLALQNATEPDHLKLGGYLIVLGEDNRPKPTLFQFPSRSHMMSKESVYYDVTFGQPSGLHPTLILSFKTGVFTSTRSARFNSCGLFAHFTFPSTIFPDRYQLRNTHLLRSLGVKGVHSIEGYTDLEAPEYAVSAWGSGMLVELSLPSERSIGSHVSWETEIPLHLRYLPPRDTNDDHTDIEIPWPVVFWACRPDEDTGDLMGNPFDRRELGYDAYFEDNTVFYHVPPLDRDPYLSSVLSVPVLQKGRLGIEYGVLQIGTGAVVLAGWLWVVWLLFRGSYGKLIIPSEPAKDKKTE